MGSVKEVKGKITEILVAFDKILDEESIEETLLNMAEWVRASNAGEVHKDNHLSEDFMIAFTDERTHMQLNGKNATELLRAKKMAEQTLWWEEV